MTLFSHDEIDAALEQVRAAGLDAGRYLSNGVMYLAGFIQGGGPHQWKHFGPWYPRAAELLNKYTDGRVDTSGWTPVDPDYLMLYNKGDEVSNLAAIFLYLARYGDYLPDAEQPHSIKTPDGDRLLYPGIGLHQER